jgi:hypothetical protein
MAIPFDCPVTCILSKAYVAKMASVEGIADEPNPEAIKLPGNYLEVAAAVSIVDSTHHVQDKASRSLVLKLSAKNGLVFMEKLIGNLNKIRDPFKAIKVTFPAKTFQLEQWLETIRIPFLFGINRNSDDLEKYNKVAKSGISAHFYKRTSDDKKMDGTFSFKIGTKDATVVVECKNRKTALDATNLQKIVENVLEVKDFKLILVFCTAVVEFPTSSSDFAKTSQSQKINIYRVRKVNQDEFDIVPFSDSWKIHAKPKNILFFLEMNYIDAPLTTGDLSNLAHEEEEVPVQPVQPAQPVRVFAKKV